MKQYDYYITFLIKFLFLFYDDLFLILKIFDNFQNIFVIYYYIFLSLIIFNIFIFN